jgi:hypothetical protein
MAGHGVHSDCASFIGLNLGTCCAGLSRQSASRGSRIDTRCPEGVLVVSAFAICEADVLNGAATGALGVVGTSGDRGSVFWDGLLRAMGGGSLVADPCRQCADSAAVAARGVG